MLCVALVLGSTAAASARQTIALADSPVARRDRDGGARRAMIAVKLDGAAPAVDGSLGDAAWVRAAVARDFVQREPDEGAPASERTEVRILYDDEAIYIGARMYDAQPDSVMASVTRRDEDATSDEVWVQLDSYFDRRTAFVFKVTPSGARADGMIVGGNRQDMGWDAVWSAAAARDSLGWVAEIAIPLTQLRFATAAGDERGAGMTWGLNLTRGRFPPVLLFAAHRPRAAGKRTGRCHVCGCSGRHPDPRRGQAVGQDRFRMVDRRVECADRRRYGAIRGRCRCARRGDCRVDDQLPGDARRP